MLVREARDGEINLRRDAASASGAEGYRLEVTPRRIEVTAATRAGLFYGGITLWQLIAFSQPRDTMTIPALSIDDAPRFAWRGLLLDSARHYQSPQFILKFLDAMAAHKLNVLHWHLTDDQAWRLEIRKYPRLTSVGAWRVPAGAGGRDTVITERRGPRRRRRGGRDGGRRKPTVPGTSNRSRAP